MYDGTTLLYFNGTAVPMGYIQYDTYKITPHTRLDLDSGLNNANGKLIRTVLPHRRSKIEFSIPPCDDVKYEEIINFIRDKWSSDDERKLTIKYYDFDTGAYSEGEFYMADWTVQIHWQNVNTERLLVDATRFAFVEY